MKQFEIFGDSQIGFDIESLSIKKLEMALYFRNWMQRELKSIPYV